MSTQDKLQKAAQLFQKGALEQAEALYREIVQQDPGESQAHYALGVIAHKRGLSHDALVHLHQAVALQPRHAQFHRATAGVYMALDAFAQAADHYAQAADINPTDAGGIYKLGIARAQAGQHAQALATFSRVLQLSRNHVEAHVASGNTLAMMQQFREAVAAYDQALRLDGANGAVWMRKGVALQHLGEHAAALQAFQHAMAQPSMDQTRRAEAAFHCANACYELQAYTQALGLYEQAMQNGYLAPELVVNLSVVLVCLHRQQDAIGLLEDFFAFTHRHTAAGHAQAGRGPQWHGGNVSAQMMANAFGARGLALQELGHAQAALHDYEEAAKWDPGSADACFNQGQMLRKLGRYGEAAAAYDRTLALQLDYPYAPGYRAHALRLMCQWEALGESHQALLEQVRAGQAAAAPFLFLSESGSAPDQLACARRFAMDKYPQGMPLWRGEAYAHSRIRVAYLSADLYDHATAYLMAELFERHDRSRFELYAFSYGPQQASPMRERLMRGFEHFKEVAHLTDQQMAEQLRACEIDILVDLKGYTADGRPGVLALRPAPVQVSYLGYPGTLGVEYVDYILGDAVVTPFEHAAYYTEKIVQLPGSYQVNDRQRAVAPETPSRAAAGLPAEGFVFCCFNNNYKITPGVFDIWMRLLARVEGSVLWLLQDNDEAAANLRKEAAARGLDPTRLVFAARMGLPEHLARQRLADLFLDTLPYNAHTTCSDALWVGLPVLTCLGHSFAGRVAASLLRAADMPELICEDLAAYEARALQLATHPEELRGLRTRLEQGRLGCALFDTDRFRRGLEQAFQVMHARQRDGMAPEAFRVPA